MRACECVGIASASTICSQMRQSSIGTVDTESWRDARERHAEPPPSSIETRREPGVLGECIHRPRRSACPSAPSIDTERDTRGVAPVED